MEYRQATQAIHGFEASPLQGTLKYMDICYRIALVMLAAALAGAGIKWIWMAMESSHPVARLDPAMLDEQIQISETIPYNPTSKNKKKRGHNKKKGKKVSSDAGRPSGEKCILNMEAQKKPLPIKSVSMAEEKKEDDEEETGSLAAVEIEAIPKDELDLEAAAVVSASKLTQIMDEHQPILDILTPQYAVASSDATDVPKPVHPIVQVQSGQSTIQRLEADLTDHHSQQVVEEFQIVQSRRRKTKAKEQQSSPTSVSLKKKVPMAKKTRSTASSSKASSPNRAPVPVNVQNLDAQSDVLEAVWQEPKPVWKGWGVPTEHKKGDVMIEEGTRHEEFPPLSTSKMNKKEIAKKEEEGKKSMPNLKIDTPSHRARLETIQEHSVQDNETPCLESAGTDTQSKPNENVLERIPSIEHIENVADAAITVRAAVTENVTELKGSVQNMVELNLASRPETSAVQSTSTAGTTTSAFSLLVDNQEPESKDTSVAASVTGGETNPVVDVPCPGCDDTNVRNGGDPEHREEAQVSSPVAPAKENSRHNSGSWADRDDDDDENGDWREDIKNSWLKNGSPST